MDLCKLLEQYNLQENIKAIEMLGKVVLLTDNVLSPYSVNKIVGTLFIHYFKSFSVKGDFKFASYIDVCLKMIIKDLYNKTELYGESWSSKNVLKDDKIKQEIRDKTSLNKYCNLWSFYLVDKMLSCSIQDYNIPLTHNEDNKEGSLIDNNGVIINNYLIEEVAIMKE